MITFKTNSSQSYATLEWVDSHEFYMDSEMDLRPLLLRPLGRYEYVAGVGSQVLYIDPEQWWALSNTTKEITENKFIRIYQPYIRGC